MSGTMWPCTVCQFYNYDKEPRCFKCFNERNRAPPSTPGGRISPRAGTELIPRPSRVLSSPMQQSPPPQRRSLTPATTATYSAHSPSVDAIMGGVASLNQSAEATLRAIREDPSPYRTGRASPTRGDEAVSAVKLERDGLQRRVRLLEDTLRTLHSSAASRSPDRGHQGVTGDTAITQQLRAEREAAMRQVQQAQADLLRLQSPRAGHHVLASPEESREIDRSRLQQRDVMTAERSLEKDEALRVVAAAERTADVLRSEAGRLRMDGANERRAMEAARLADREEAAAIQASLRNECDSLRAEISQMRRVNDVFHPLGPGEGTRHTAEDDASRAEVLRLKRQGYTLHASEARLSAEVESISRQLEQSNRDADRYRGEALAMRRRADEAQDGMASSTARLTTERDEAMKTARQSAADVSSQRAEIQRLLKQVGDATVRETELRRSYLDDTAVTLLRTELSVLRSGQGALQDERDEAVRTAREARDMLAEARGDLQRARLDLHAKTTGPDGGGAAGRVAELESDVARLREMLADAVQSMRRETEQTYADADVLRAQFAAAHDETMRLEAENRQILTQLDVERSAQVGQGVAGKAFQIEKFEMQQKIAAYEEAAAADARKMQLLTAQNQKLSSQLEGLAKGPPEPERLRAAPIPAAAGKKTGTAAEPAAKAADDKAAADKKAADLAEKQAADDKDASDKAAADKICAEAAAENDYKAALKAAEKTAADKKAADDKAAADKKAFDSAAENDYKAFKSIKTSIKNDLKAADDKAADEKAAAEKKAEQAVTTEKTSISAGPTADVGKGGAAEPAAKAAEPVTVAKAVLKAPRANIHFADPAPAAADAPRKEHHKPLSTLPKVREFVTVPDEWGPSMADVVLGGRTVGECYSLKGACKLLRTGREGPEPSPVVRVLSALATDATPTLRFMAGMIQ